jgi:coenzyme F420-0:L-glutamate ligase/coenzyme F420-1:gamma-L-glutamate ligase
MVKAGDDLASLIGERLTRRAGVARGDVLVLAQKIVSKAEGRMVEIATGEAVATRDRAWRRGPEGPAAGRADPVGIGARGALAAQRADRRAQARLRHGQCRHRPVERGRTDGVERALLLPVDPDASAEALRARLGATALLIIDSFGRPWRRGTTGVAIGAAGCRRCSTCAAIPTCSAASCRSASAPSPTRSRRRRRW